MRNAGLEETQAGIKIAGRNINNFRYADDTTLLVESEEELSCFFDDPTDVDNLISDSCAFSMSENFQLEHLDVHGSCTAEAWLGEF